MTRWDKFKRAFFYRNGQFSKTAVFLSVAVTLTLLMWPFQSLFVGTTFWYWTVPPFNSEAALAVIGVISSLYVANHSSFIRGKPEEKPVDD